MPVFFLLGRSALMKNAAERRATSARAAHFGREPCLSGEDERPRPAAFARTGKLVRTAARFDGASPEAERDLLRLVLRRRPISENGNEIARGRSPGAGDIL
jgi:hypothetical protein